MSIYSNEVLNDILEKEYVSVSSNFKREVRGIDMLGLDNNGFVQGLNGANVYDHIVHWDIFPMVQVGEEWYHLSLSEYESIMNSYYMDTELGQVYFEDSYELEKMRDFLERVYKDTSFEYLIEDFKKFKNK